MRRNLILVLAIVVGLFLANSSIAKIASFRGTSNEVSSARAKLDQLKQENAQLKQDLAYKKSDQFAEGEIRDKLGLAKPGEQVFVVPKDAESKTTNAESQNQEPNWQKWKDYLF